MNDEQVVVYGEEDTNEARRPSYEPPMTVRKETYESAGSEGMSLLAELAEVAHKEIDRNVKLEVDPTIRPGGWILEFSAVIDAGDIRSYQRAATNNGKTKPENADNVKGNALPLIQKSIGIWKGTQQVFDEDNEPLTLHSWAFLKMMGEKEGSPDSVRALKKFLGDAQIFTMGQALLHAAGYGDEMVPVDPTSD